MMIIGEELKIRLGKEQQGSLSMIYGLQYDSVRWENDGNSCRVSLCRRDLRNAAL